ncbi:hypothetical protein ABI_18980 [Asticcacaulis biprosthecium C19]|uniref:DUF465 domain-containing protein n=1 Tax=Asticcacaulis biprosthecium C19 TaxID=715226 RepID=F4QL83_9CAUL|nr:DUF465 domain-containing protein [Asticcacaulis biprosthecium]EGF93458.1 hypothetical protein ABI_18980 [Asticcacaulis biprosthecium C19]
MSIEARVRELDHRHQTLKTIIAREERSPSVDSLYLTELKRKKLKLKEEIERIRAHIRHDVDEPMLQ